MGVLIAISARVNAHVATILAAEHVIAAFQVCQFSRACTDLNTSSTSCLHRSFRLPSLYEVRL